MTASQSQISISPRQLYQLLAGDSAVKIIDVRTPFEHAEVSVDGAALVPLDQLDCTEHLKQRGADDKPIYVLCQSGGRARKAIERFRQAGFDGCVLIEGGLQAWIDAGLPVTRRQRPRMPLIRQMQIAAGLITGTGAALALLVNPYFAFIPLFTGCGLLFAGLTGFCGMILLLAKMPWNRVDANPVSGCRPVGRNDSTGHPG
jgi:rhodanese-related sulfurtransferase